MKLDWKIPMKDEDDGERTECFFCTPNKEFREVATDQYLGWLVSLTGKTKEDYLNHLTEIGEIHEIKPTETETEETKTDS